MTLRPTHVRYEVVGLATLMAVLLYLDRFCLSLIEGFVREDLGLDKTQAGILFSVFFWAYALGQVPSGWLSDRFGARMMLALYIVGWSVFTGLMGLAQGFVAILLFRFGCGLTQAGAYPTSAALISKWMPFAARGRASGIVSTGGRIGGALAPILTGLLLVAFVPLRVPSLLGENDLLDADAIRERLTAPKKEPADQVAAFINSIAPAASQTDLLQQLNDVLRRPEFYERVRLEDFKLPNEAWRLARVPGGELSEAQVTRRNRLLLEAAFPGAIRQVYGQGWRPTVLIYGIAGLVVAAWFWLRVRDRPEAHPGVSPAEIAVIESARPATATSARGRAGTLPLRAILENRSLWCSAFSQFGTNFGWIFLTMFVPRYLEEAHRVPVVERGWMASLPILVGMAGMLTGGWLTDRLTRALGLRWGRRLPMCATRFVAMGAYIACLYLDTAWTVTIAFCVVAVATDLGTASVWAFKQDIGGRYVGAVLGWGNMWGNFGAAVAPLVLTPIIAQGWNWCFAACATAFAVAGIAALGVDATKPLRVEHAQALTDERET